MKSKYLFLSVLGTLAAAGLTGCYEMDTQPMDQNVTDQQKTDAKEAIPENAQASITGISAVFSSYNANFADETHSDFGFASTMIGNDCRGVDMVSDVLGYNWFSNEAQMGTCSNTDDLTIMTWKNCYRQIFAANAAIKGINPETEDATLQFYLAQALAMRANDYFILAQNYQFTYKGNEDKPCVMLITEKNEEEVAIKGAGRATVAAIYTQIMEDLDNAVAMLEASGIRPEQVVESKPKRFISLATAYGLRARVNLVMNEWDAAASDAENAIKNFNGKAKSLAEASKPSFNSLLESDWMWGIPIASTDRVVTSGIVNWPSHMGSFNYGYATAATGKSTPWRRINKKLFNSIPVSDVRRGWFLDGDKYSPNLTEAQQAFLDKKEALPFTQVKFAPYGDVIGTNENANDIPLMRIEEMYLIQAEATAMAGGDGASILNEFVSTYRDPQYSFSGSAADVQEECFRQRRIELFGEGLIFYDYMRLKKDFDRRGGGWQSTICYNVPAGSPVLLLVIPNAEINGNKLFNGADNNAPAPHPDAVPDID